MGKSSTSTTTEGDSSQKPAKRPAHRPSTFRPEYVKQAYNLAKLGAVDIQIAEAFGINQDTLYVWKNEFPQLSEAINLAKEDVNSRVEQSLYNRAMGVTCTEEREISTVGEGGLDVVRIEKVKKQLPPDSTAAIFWLKNRRRNQWREESSLNVDAHITHQVDAPRETYDQWVNRIQAEKDAEAIDVTPD